MTWLAQLTTAEQPVHGETAPSTATDTPAAPRADQQTSSHPFAQITEVDFVPWWRRHRFVTFGGSLLLVLWFFANVVGVMTATGFFAQKTEEPNELPTIEVVVLGSVGDGYRAGRIGRQEGTATEPNLRREPPAASSPQPQASKPIPPAPPQPTVPVQPTQPKPVNKPIQPQPTQPKPLVKPAERKPEPYPTFPKPLPTKPIEKEMVAKKGPVEEIPLLPPPPPPMPEQPKTTAPIPTKPVEAKPTVQPPSKPAVDASSSTQDKPSQPPTSVAANGTVGATGGESSKGDSDHNGSGRRRGTRGSGGEGDGVDPPSGFFNPNPPYPASALAEGREGRVVLWIRIGSDGFVEWAKVHISSGDPEMDESALSTVRRWRFNPSRNRKTGQPVASEHYKNIDFKMVR